MCRVRVCRAAAAGPLQRLPVPLLLLLLALVVGMGGHVTTAVPTSSSRQDHWARPEAEAQGKHVTALHVKAASLAVHSTPEVHAFSAWSTWSACGRRCTQTRRRRCLQPALCGAAIFKEERWCGAGAACGGGGSGGGGGGRRAFHVVPQKRLPGPGGGNGSGRRGGAGEARLRYNSKLYGRWTRWTPCTRSCTTQRYRRCKRPALCGADVIREAAFCYVEGSFCQRWIERRIQQQRADEDNETDGDLASEPWATESAVGEAGGAGAAAEEQGCGMEPVTASLAANASAPWAHLRIIGGRPSAKGRWPWQVAVLNRFREAFCGGTLVAARWVLTAAHCVRKRLYVRVGEHDLSTHEGTELELKVLEAVAHPAYDADTVDNDVALLRLAGAVRPGRWRAFACLPRARQPLPTHQLCSIIGWGKRRPADAFGTDILHEAQVPIVSWKACREVYSDYHITANMFCAGYARGRMDSCAGDSGGPLLCRAAPSPGDAPRWTVFGITSFGEGCGKRGKFGIYTRLPNYVAWAQAEMRRREARPPAPGPALVPVPARRRRRRRRRGRERARERGRGKSRVAHAVDR